jgi:hypothetical protein
LVSQLSAFSFGKANGARFSRSARTLAVSRYTKTPNLKILNVS